MFELENQKVEVLAVDPIKADEKEKSTGLAKVILSFQMTETNDFLSHISSDLKHCLYRKDDVQDDIIVDVNHLTVLRNPLIVSEYRVDKNFAKVGCPVSIVWGIGSEIVLQNATAYDLRFLPQEGGTCLYKFKVKGEVTEKEAGIICANFITNEVELSIGEPVIPENNAIEFDGED